MLPVSSHPPQPAQHATAAKPIPTNVLPLPSFTPTTGQSSHIPTARLNTVLPPFSLPTFAPPAPLSSVVLPAFPSIRSTSPGLPSFTALPAPRPLFPAHSPPAPLSADSRLTPAAHRTVSPQPLSPSPAAAAAPSPRPSTSSSSSSSTRESSPARPPSAVAVLLAAVSSVTSVQPAVQPSVVGRLIAHDTADVPTVTSAACGEDGSAVRLTPTLHPRIQPLYAITQLALH